MDAPTLDALADRITVRVLAALRGTAAAPLPRVLSGTEALSVEGFAAAVGRSEVWVYRQIRARRIAVRKCGKPYQIPCGEIGKFTKTTATT
ncbi:MAG: hypothetical protein Q8M02_10490 [Candidatus Didemnitutus sp.]|nr:hypothetical protein [Candidatus Didemnitutus sp.]